MSEIKNLVELPSYLSIDTDDGLKIEIDTDKFLSSLPTGVLTDALTYRHDYDPLDGVDTYVLVEELHERDHDLTKELDDEEIEFAFFNRNIANDRAISDYIHQAVKMLSPREVLDKERMKELLNDWIDLNVTHSFR